MAKAGKKLKKLETKVRKLAKKIGEKGTAAVKKPHVSPLAPPAFPELPVIEGVRFAATQAGVRYAEPHRRDAGATCARHCDRRRLHPVRHPRGPGARLRGEDRQGVDRGRGDHRQLRQRQRLHRRRRRGGRGAGDRRRGRGARHPALPRLLLLDRRDRRTLPFERIVAAIGALKDALSPDGIAAAARAIMTTDTFPKGAAAEVDIDGQPVGSPASPRARA
jgi:glutamate N-acetyltransferase / amino-acid N-acetyltransferase